RSRDEPLSRRRSRRPGRDDRHRGRRRRSRSNIDDRRERRQVRPRPVAPASRPCGPRHRRVLLCPGFGHARRDGWSASPGGQGAARRIRPGRGGLRAAPGGRRPGPRPERVAAAPRRIAPAGGSPSACRVGQTSCRSAPRRDRRDSRGRASASPGRARDRLAGPSGGRRSGLGRRIAPHVPEAGRVIAGTARGIRLLAPGPGTRPLADRVKQTLFAILEPELPGAVVLDLFTGSGAAGIEALSRGAQSAVFVEKDAGAARVIAENLRRTRLAGPRVAVVRGDVLRWLALLASEREGCFGETALTFYRRIEGPLEIEEGE